MSSRAPTPLERRQAMARAIRELRESATPDLSQGEAAARAGLKRQTWSLYETGERHVVLNEDLQRQLARALGVTRQALTLEYERQLREAGFDPEAGPEPEARAIVSDRRQRPFLSPFAAPPPGAELHGRDRILACLNGPTTRTLQLTNDNLSPWARSGMTIVYDVELWPRSEDGCVVIDEAGTEQVKIFVRADSEAVHVRELLPEVREFAIPRTPTLRIHRVMARLD